jgi:hypothetical protein
MYSGNVLNDFVPDVFVPNVSPLDDSAVAVSAFDGSTPSRLRSSRRLPCTLVLRPADSFALDGIEPDGIEDVTVGRMLHHIPPVGGPDHQQVDPRSHRQPLAVLAGACTLFAPC